MDKGVGSLENWTIFIDIICVSSDKQNFDSFLRDTYNTGLIYTLINRCFQICSSWSMFHQKLILLRDILKNGYPENFIDRCFKLFLNRIHILKKSFYSLKEASAISSSLFRNYNTAD